MAVEPMMEAMRVLEDRGLADTCRLSDRGELTVHFETLAGTFPLRMFYVEEDDMLTVVAFVSQRVPTERMDDVDSLLCGLNWGAPGSAYLAVDHDDGEVSARAALPVASLTACRPAVAALVDAVIEMLVVAVPLLPRAPTGLDSGPQRFWSQGTGTRRDVN